MSSLLCCKITDFNSGSFVFIDQKGGSLVLYPREILYIESIKGLKNQVMVKTTTEDKLVNTSLKQLKTELEKYASFLLLNSYCITLQQLP